MRTHVCCVLDYARLGLPNAQPGCEAPSNRTLKGEQLISDINIVNNGGECAQQVAA